MRNRTRRMHQTATYWGPPTDDGLGHKTFPSPIEIEVRWQDKAQMFTDPEGKERVSQSIVYCSQPVEVGGFLLKGSHGTASPLSIGGKEIAQRWISPSLRADEQLTKAVL